MVAFENLDTVSYSQPIITMTISCIISAIERHIGRKSPFFHTPCIGRPLRCIAVTFDVGKLRWCSYPTDRYLVTAQSALCIASRGKKTVIWASIILKDKA